MYQGHAPLGIIQFWSLFWNAFFPESLEKGNAASECGKLNVENRFCGLQMVQFESPRVTQPFVSFTFGSTVGCPFILHAGTGKYCMWPPKKVEI